MQHKEATIWIILQNYFVMSMILLQQTAITNLSTVMVLLTQHLILKFGKNTLTPFHSKIILQVTVHVDINLML